MAARLFPLSSRSDHTYDLVCAGFGPASLAIAIALWDRGVQARAVFLERQRNFSWHAGMLLPNARMQISFLKDLATLRNPRSKFTFINYLRSKNRLVSFSNLSTFLPLREEYNDYMTWCAAHFDPCVRYGEEVVSIGAQRVGNGPVQSWSVVSKNVDTGEQTCISARHIVVALGGKPRIPPALLGRDLAPVVVHSSTYTTAVPQRLTDKNRPYNLAVVGGGQSAAEIFNDLPSKYPKCKVTLFTGASALKPSDDSPFVNDIFDPDCTHAFYMLPQEARQKNIQSNKATNYGVVRPELIDHLYEVMYQQRLREPDENKWQRRIVPWKEVIGCEPSTSDACYDLVLAGTGYERKSHESLLSPTKEFLQSNQFEVERDYKVKYRKDAVADSCGIWLQGCCEDSHGLSDTLLSVLAVRGGEIVESIFPSSEWESVQSAKL
ncbi:MAG: hypothetical protein Q9190_000219 [Brigantiaea leucoxantha]